MSQLFYVPKIESGFAVLDTEESRHLVSVLRRKTGDTVQLTDGKGCFYQGMIDAIGKKETSIRILDTQSVPEPEPRLFLAVAPTKSIDRFEWMLEKAVEVGIHAIIPLRCRRSERDTVRIDRLEKVVVSAAKQSLRAWFPVVHPLTDFQQVIKEIPAAKKYIAWCDDAPRPHLKSVLTNEDTLILIGPEGDFTPAEVELAQQQQCTEISLGQARLRTETAGLVATVIFNTMNSI
jgi:16S rRNA (uracil1498-N3)-methyltransferase